MEKGKGPLLMLILFFFYFGLKDFNSFNLVYNGGAILCGVTLIVVMLFNRK